MSDKELLELAAKAAINGGVIISGSEGRYQIKSLEGADALRCGEEWNPLTDDGDALRLAVKLGLTIELFQEEPPIAPCTAASNSLMPRGRVLEYHTSNTDPYAATRRAIVRAAAEIGRGL